MQARLPNKYSLLGGKQRRVYVPKRAVACAAAVLSSFAFCGMYFFQRTSSITLSWTKTPPDIAIVVPFTRQDFPKVLKAVQVWSKHGDSCPTLRRLSRSPLHLLFWFNRNLNQTSEAQQLLQQIASVLRPSASCFSSVRFDSANLTDEEDPYPFGPTHQWYKLYMSPSNPLAPYNYFLWAEFDLMPVRSGWMDALVREVTFNEGFYVRGSLHRGSKLDIAATEEHTARWITHINGNALYACKDETFRALVKACYERRADASNGFLASFDVAIWMEYVTSYMTTWHSYQRYAHKFQYTEFMQNIGDGLSAQELARVLRDAPGTYMIHGATESAGEKHRQKASAQRSASERLSGDRLAVVMPLIESQVPKTAVLFRISSQPEFAACTQRTGIDLILHLSQPWKISAKTHMRRLLRNSPRFTRCFRSIMWAHANLPPDSDVHTGTVFTGPNLHFRQIVSNATFRRAYDAIFILEPDTTPIRAGWLGAMRELAKTKEPFWIRGTAYRGFREDWLRNGFGSRSTSIWTAMNGNALYWLQDERFFEFLDRVWGKYPDAPYDIAIFSYLQDLANFPYTKVALARIHYTDFIQNWGGTQYDVKSMQKASPRTYLVHSSCRPEFGADRKLYCFVCDADQQWSDSCMIKLRSPDLNLGYDRFVTGPTYHGISINNANAANVTAAGITL